MADTKEVPWPRRTEAQEYLEKHKILQLFDNFTAQLIYNRPDKPKEFLIQQLESLKVSKTTLRDFPCLFDDSNILAVFGMLDPTGKGFISHQQYLEAFSTLGIKEFEQRPMGADNNKIAYDTFAREAAKGLKEASATFEQK